MTEEMFQENEEFELLKVTNTSLFMLRRKDGEELDDRLKGKYTKPSLAIKDVDAFLQREIQKEAIKVAEDKGVKVSNKQKEKVEADGSK